MAVVVVGGHSRNVGKTSVVAGLIAAVPERRWTAFKITQFGHGVCSADGKPCGCDTGDHLVAVTEERSRGSGTDTARYLAAGAERSLWVRTRQGMLAEAMPRIRREMQAAEDVILESNSILRFLKPDLFLSVLDPTVADFKPSARYFLDRADGVLLPDGLIGSPNWQQVSPGLLRGAAILPTRAPVYCTKEVVSFVRQRLGPGRLGSVPAGFERHSCAGASELEPRS